MNNSFNSHFVPIRILSILDVCDSPFSEMQMRDFLVPYIYIEPSFFGSI
jgi:hypothetical protein